MSRDSKLSTREALLKATLEVAAKDGLRAVTHRKVAAQAQVSLSATSYHLSNIDSILLESLGHFVDRMIDKYDRPFQEAKNAKDMTEAIVGLILVLHDNRDDAVLMYELYAQAARDPRYEALVRRWSSSTQSALERLFPEDVAIELEAVLEGMLVQRLFGQRQLSEDAMRQFLGAIMRGKNKKTAPAPDTAVAVQFSAD